MYMYFYMLFLVNWYFFLLIQWFCNSALKEL